MFGWDIGHVEVTCIFSAARLSRVARAAHDDDRPTEDGRTASFFDEAGDARAGVCVYHSVYSFRVAW
jgi:hypothetical protein